MITNVLQYLENTALRLPDKPAFYDETGVWTAGEMLHAAKAVGTALAKTIPFGAPVAVLAEKGNRTLAAFFGAVYAGGFYSLLNPELPDSRLLSVLETLGPAAIVTDEAHLDRAAAVAGNTPVLDVSALLETSPDDTLLAGIRARAIDVDPLYANFTSGSTGVPKGVLVCHRSVVDFIEHFTEIFGIDETDVIGNQAPFDFDVSVKDIYGALKTGAALVLIPRALFMRPTALMDLICEQNVTTMTWAVSALSLLSTFHALDYRAPTSVRRVLFSGEVMPKKVLDDFMAHLPEAAFVNLYGPTEITCNCTYHVVERGRDYPDGLPLGVPFPNERVLLLKDDGTLANPGEVGEIAVAGTAPALGYLNAPDLTDKAFVQNPTVKTHRETVYRTGDLGRLGDDGLYYFCGRRDLQIKHQGHRIELEEIEVRFSRLPGVSQCCCVYDYEKHKIRGYYVGDADKADVHRALKDSLPAFMVPNVLTRLDAFPLNKNGKIDRKALN
ncbi:MAG: amino acid adenylation domain-containing protein [Clostridia bacterium]|nr:amino acid adenylation domain-containing protein [Clostridia bacterium]